MQKITSIHLNGKAYQLEEAGFENLRTYLTQAEQQLTDNPDKTEIINDLEQAKTACMPAAMYKILFSSKLLHPRALAVRQL